MLTLKKASSETGVALISVLLLVLVMSGMTAALTVSGNTETMIARNHESSAQARAAAEAGLTHALQITITNLQSWSTNGFASPSAAMSRLLRGPDDNAAVTADNGSLENLPSGIPRAPARLLLADLTNIGYEARVFDEDDAARGTTLTETDITRIGENNETAGDANTRIVVRAIGYAGGDSMATVEATLTTMPLPAIVSNGPLKISGSPSVSGAQGSVHTNQDLEINGNPTVTGNATATGTYTTTGTPNIGGQAGGGYGNISVPSVRAIDHLGKADFILNSDGPMTTVATNATVACNPCAGAWTFGAGTWSITGNTAPTAGTFYVEGNATISGHPGSPASPARLTIIAEGSIVISGNPDLQPQAPELLFVTDGDLKITGNVGANYMEGQMLVREQLHIAGNPDLAGQIIVENAANLSNLVTTTDIVGNPTIVYNGLAGAVWFNVSSWRWVQ